MLRVRPPRPSVAVVEAAEAAGVALLACAGALGGPKADSDLAADHKGMEQAILTAPACHDRMAIRA